MTYDEILSLDQNVLARRCGIKYTTAMFGDFVKEIRVRQRLGLREFCLKHTHDPSNWSKIEREVLPPPRRNETLRKWAKQLNLKPDSDDWHRFFDCAAMDAGRIPKHVLNGVDDDALAKQIPDFFHTLSGRAKLSSAGSAASYATWCKARDLRTWADSLEAQEKLPSLIRKLIHGTIANPTLSQFPADEGTRRRGWDGVLTVDRGNAWVPKGVTVWEMGVDQKPETKANSDYKKRTKSVGAEARSSTFVFVSPRKWEAKTKWVSAKRREKKWLDVLVWDCDDLEQWLETAPAVDAWLARLLGKLPAGVRDLSSYWLSLAWTSDPPFTPATFLAGRTKAEREMRNALASPPAEIAISALSLAELRDFVAAVLANGDEEAENAATARALVVDTVDAWNQLSTAKNRLLLIPNDQLALEKPMVAEAVRAGHHVLTQRPYTVVRSEAGIRLPRADRSELQKALEDAGFSEERANRLAREAGGCISILTRLASRFSGQAIPAWSKPQEATPLLPLVLIGAWADRNEADRKLVERFTGQSYANLQQLATRWINHADAPLRLAEGIYSFVSREDSWKLLNSSFTNDLLDDFTGIAKEVLGENDPRFDVPVGERYLAGIHKKLPKFSPELREGIAETIALLGTRGEHTPQGAPEGSSSRAARLVRELLDQASPKRWFSLAHNVPLLAEAAPDEFLAALEEDFQQPAPAIATLFEKDADGFFSSSPHTSLMWALQLLAWDTTHLSRVVLALATLIKLDTGGRMNPRPAGVLFDIFRFWFPQTSATIEERFQVLELLSKREPEIAWTLLLGLIPHGHDTATASVKPRWRDWDSSQTEKITDRDIRRQTQWAGNRLVQIAETSPEKWETLLKDFARVPEVVQTRILQWLRAIDLASLAPSERVKDWESVRNLVREHRFFHDAWWALPRTIVNELAEIEQMLAPDDPLEKWKGLFGGGGFHAFGDTETPFEEREKLEATAQSQALREVYQQHGLTGVLKLASTATTSAFKIGHLLGTLNLLPNWQELLPEKLISSGAGFRDVALGYAMARRNAEGDQWMQKLPVEDWQPHAVAEIFLILDCNQATWNTLQKRKPDAELAYWRLVHPFGERLNNLDLQEVVRSLLKAQRPIAAVDILVAAIHSKTQPKLDQVADTLEMAATKPEVQLNSHTIWNACELMKYLQNQSTPDSSRLASIEWLFLPVARHHHFSPKTLHSELSKNPTFFAEAITAIYRGKGQPRNANETPDPRKESLAEAANDLLDSWDGLPGVRPFTPASLMDWVVGVRKFCVANGRLEVCDLKIGEQLACAPADADGLWPCEPVREVLEAVRTDEILRGFSMAVFNARGVTSRGIGGGGEQERALVSKYRSNAEKCKVRWSRTSLVLRRIAEHYEADAKRHDERAEARN